MNMADRVRQEDEVASLAEIYDSDEFSYDTIKESDGSRIKCRLSGIFDLPEKVLKVKYLNQNLRRRCPSLPYLKFFVRHLPPATLDVTLPPDYPTLRPPDFRVSISWLPPLETSKICQKLDELWSENEGNEILFIWMNFFKFELLAFLQIEYCLDVSFLFTAFEEPEDYSKSDLARLSDSRATNEKMFLNPRVYLAKYDSSRHQIEFGKGFHPCKICLEEFPGRQCVEFNRCGHVYCRSCVQKYLRLSVKERRVNCIPCPEQKCKSEIAPEQIKELVEPEIYERYERLLLQVTLDAMNDIVYCPRLDCQYPAIKEEDDNLVTCANCRYNFCAYCRKGYHGVAPCLMSSQDQSKLVVEYQTADREQRKLLEKKYGRRQLQIVVERHLTNSYLKENTKQCPNCSSSVTKIEGCNKMICAHCQAQFCWLCGKHLTGSNPYSHFNDSVENPCYERLFEGITFEADIFEDDIEEEVWEAFPQAEAQRQ